MILWFMEEGMIFLQRAVLAMWNQSIHRPRVPGVTPDLTALLLQAVLLPPALAPAQPEQFSSVQHLKQLSWQKDSPALEGSGVGGVIPGC